MSNINLFLNEETHLLELLNEYPPFNYPYYTGLIITPDIQNQNSFSIMQYSSLSEETLEFFTLDELKDLLISIQNAYQELSISTMDFHPISSIDDLDPKQWIIKSNLFRINDYSVESMIYYFNNDLKIEYMTFNLNTMITLK